MVDQHTFLLSFQYLLKHKPLKLLLLFVLTLFLGTSSGFSIILLVPLLQLLTSDNIESSNHLVLLLKNLADNAHVALNIVNILTVYILLLGTIAILNYWKSMISARYKQTLIFDIRQRLFRKIIMADWAHLNNKSKTNHLQILTQEIPQLSNYFFYFLKLLVAVIMTFSYLVWALLISVKFTLVIIVIGMILSLLLRKFLFKAFHLGEEYVSAYMQLLKYIDDFWSTVKIAKVHSSEDFYYKKFDTASSSLLDVEYVMQKNHQLPQLIFRLIGLLVLAFVVYIGYTFELIPLTSFFILIILFAKLYPEFTSINKDVNMMVSQFASVKLVMKLDSEFVAPNMRSHEIENPQPFNKMLTLENIYFKYPAAKPLLENLSVNIPAYHITGIIGESGRGKTTLLDIIAGLQKPQSGHILVDSSILKGDDWSRWRNGIGYLPQDSFFIDGTLRENLIWDCRAAVTDDEIKNVLEQVNALHLINRFESGLDEHIVNYPFHFSGGERQRLALTRVLLRKPQILLLDEATSSLDLENENQIMNLLVRLKKTVTILLVTHKTSVEPWLDLIIKLETRT
jgi:ATP-binding cassette subfamily C protein